MTWTEAWIRLENVRTTWDHWQVYIRKMRQGTVGIMQILVREVIGRRSPRPDLLFINDRIRQGFKWKFKKSDFMRFFCFLGTWHSYMLLTTWGSSSDHFQRKCTSRSKSSISSTHSDISQALFFLLHQWLKNKDTQILNFLVIRLLNFSSPGNTVSSTFSQLPATRSPASTLVPYRSFYSDTSHSIEYQPISISCSTTHFIKKSSCLTTCHESIQGRGCTAPLILNRSTTWA